jgi:hypothetical protein
MLSGETQLWRAVIFTAAMDAFTKTVDKKRKIRRSDVLKNVANKKKTRAKVRQTIDEYMLGLEEKRRFYHEIELNKKHKELRWFYDENEDFSFVCEMAGLEGATVRQLLEESLAIGSVKPMKRIYNY